MNAMLKRKKMARITTTSLVMTLAMRLLKGGGSPAMTTADLAASLAKPIILLAAVAGVIDTTAGRKADPTRGLAMTIAVAARKASKGKPATVVAMMVVLLLANQRKPMILVVVAVVLLANPVGPTMLGVAAVVVVLLVNLTEPGTETLAEAIAVAIPGRLMASSTTVDLGWSC
jgi:hypothetical protein